MIHDVTEDDPLTLTVSGSGSVLLGTSEHSLRFRTLAAFDRAIEGVDRQRAILGWTRSAVDLRADDDEGRAEDFMDRSA